ncbi:MAG TPA: lipocalin-like domain-containing protein [Ardenticatenaceae bacterium]|jgi:predicted secreted hydrolase
MNRRGWIAILVLVVALVGAGAWVARRPARANNEVRSSLIETMGGPVEAEGFARATDPAGMSFPDAFGPHPSYQTEWWYYTGNVQTAEGRAFGYQFTIFRRSLTPSAPERESAFATNDVYMAHFAVTDAGGSRFFENERFQRGGGGAAGAQAEPYRVWLDDWSVEEIEPEVYRMRAQAEEVMIDFTLRSAKPPARHGNNGLSQKSGEVGNASYYYSQTRLETTGTLAIGEQRFEVGGLSWKDHEYGTSSLAENAAGWDWFSLQLSDGRELMYFQIRTVDGGVEPASSGSLVLEDGTVRPLAREAVQVEVLETWTSPESGGVYPAKWLLRVPSEGIELTITPLIPDQELNVSATYWEGAVVAEGSAGGQPITARGYIELTGYAGERAPSV